MNKFKERENDPAILKRYGFCAFEFGKEATVNVDGKREVVGIFWPYKDLGVFPKFGCGMWHVTADGWRVEKSNKSECLDGVWAQYGPDSYTRIDKLF